MVFFGKDELVHRACGNQEWDVILEMKDMALTGVFPKIREEKVASGPMTLLNAVNHQAMITAVWCS